MAVTAAKLDAIDVTPPDRYRVLAIDDQPEVLTALRRLLRSRGFDVEPCTCPTDALTILGKDPDRFDVLVLDVNMPGMSGLELLPRAKEIAPEVPIVMLTADDRASTAVKALKAGAFNYLVKPLDDPETISITLNRAGSYSQLQRRTRHLEHRVSVAERFETLVGSSAAMRQVFATIDKLSTSDVSVLIRGESGTGKELVARAIHARSARSRCPFVALNCAAIPEALIDSELFGYTKGAFTGAVTSRQGVFGEADGGTLFLDEIGDVPLPVQLRLLRVLQEREVRPVGGNGARSVDVRVIAATHVDLDGAVHDKRFRADLFYRLNVIGLNLPPLRERMEDLPILASHLMQKHATKTQRHTPKLTAGAMNVLSAYSWPGNVRELENAIQHAMALAAGDEIDADALPRRICDRSGASLILPSTAAEPKHDLSWADELGFNDARKQAQSEFERSYMRRLLTRTHGNISEAARIAGLDRSNFRRVLTRLQINAADHRLS